MAPADDRGVSEVVGAVVIFGFLVIAFAIYQGVVIPQQNKAIEFDHNGAAQDAIQDLRNAIRQTATTGTEEAVSIKLGATYPPRVLGINPGGSAGTMTTEAPGSIVIRNISGTEAEVADYFGDSSTTLGPFGSKVIVYRPIYFQYREAPSSSYENSVAFNHFPNGANLSMTNQALIKDRRITLIALNGTVSEARSDTVSIDTEALSTATNTVTVTNKSGPINITITTRLTADEWEDLFEGEMTSAGGHVEDVTQTGPNQVSILLKPGVTYELRLAKVGVGTDTRSEGPTYIVDVEGDETSIPENGTQKLVAEVRDRYNNPVSNVTVDAQIRTSAGSGDFVTSMSTNKTDADGRVRFLYTAPSDVNGTRTAKIDVSFDGDGTTKENVTFDVRVLDADGSGGDDGVSEVNPSGERKLVLEDADGGSTATAQLRFDNTGDTDITAEAIRVPFYFEESAGQGETEVVESFAGVQTFDGADTLPIGAPLTGLDSPVTFAPGTTTVSIEFGGPTSNLQTQGDFFILVLELDSGSTVTYFVAPQ